MAFVDYRSRVRIERVKGHRSLRAAIAITTKLVFEARENPAA